MKKLICMILTLVMALSLVACGNKEEKVVSADGSTSMQKVISALGEAFMEDTGANFTYNATGSGTGIKAVKDGTCDIGLSSRYLKDSEKAEGLKETILAIDGIAIIVHTDNTVTDLTVEQIAAIFKGEITNWSEVGGKDGEIVCIGREESSGTRDGFESITDTEDACVYRQELTSNGAVLTAVAENPNAIGYVSLSSVKDTVKAISVSGVAPSEATIKDGSYAVQRPFVLVTKEGMELSKTAQEFFDFATSPAANEIITAAGVVPVNYSSLTSYASHPVVNITINIIEQGNQWAFVLHTFGVKLFNFPTMGFMLADLNYEELA